MLLQGETQQAERWAKARFSAWLKKSGSRESSPAKPRKVAELRALAKEAEKLRQQHEAKVQAQQEADRRKKREAYLRTLATDFDHHWSVADQYAERGTASGYDQAKRAIIDLADAYTLASDRNAFDKALRRFMVRHAKRGALVRRLVEGGLYGRRWPAGGSACMP